MWKATIGAATINSNDADDDWETDPDFINNVTEQEQRWGSKTIEGSGRTVGAIDMNKLREETTRAHELQKLQQKEDAPNASYGYGGKFGIEKDRMDKSAVGHDYIAKVEKHVSQTDYSAGFGGKFGVQTDRVDKSAVSWDHKESLHKHASQKDYSSGFGGKFGIEKDRQDKSAVGWDHVEKLQKHDSQTVGKREDIIMEQMQKPSQLKAKFESLAKQNEVKPIEKKKPISIQRGTPPVSNIINASNKVQEPNKSQLEEKMRQERERELERERQREEEQKMQEKLRQMQIEEQKQQELLAKQQEEKLKQMQLEEQQQQELLARQQQEALQAQKQEEMLAQQQENQVKESIQSTETTTYTTENEINANTIPDEEQIYEQVDGCCTAIALYDYQAAADDEISFDPDDIITNIEKIDKGWWRGTCLGRTGLFPANYVAEINNE